MKYPIAPVKYLKYGSISVSSSKNCMVLHMAHIMIKYSISFIGAFWIHLLNMGDMRYSPRIMYTYQNCIAICVGFKNPSIIYVVKLSIFQFGLKSCFMKNFIIAYIISQKIKGISIRFILSGIFDNGCCFLSIR